MLSILLMYVDCYALALQVTNSLGWILFGLLISFMCVLNMVFNEMHMRYIDKIHYAKNELARDKQIIRRYLTTIHGS